MRQDEGGRQEAPDDEPPPPELGWPWGLATCGCLALGALTAVGLLIAGSIPYLIEARKSGTPPLSGLSSLRTAQSLFREGDKEGDGTFDYGDLAELSDASLVDGVLGSGSKNGYLFACRPSETTPEFLWMATATPARPGRGDRYFAINQSGVIFTSQVAPIPLDARDCQLPPPGRPDVRPIGR